MIDGEAIKREFRSRLSKVNDQFALWFSHINWVKNNFPRPGRGEYLCQLTEECCKCFYEEEKYRNDERLLEIFMLYGEFGKCKLDLFEFLFKNGISIKLPKFWMYLAKEVARFNELALAACICQIGLSHVDVNASELKKCMQYLNKLRMNDSYQDPVTKLPQKNAEFLNNLIASLINDVKNIQLDSFQSTTSIKEPFIEASQKAETTKSGISNFLDVVASNYNEATEFNANTPSNSHVTIYKDTLTLTENPITSPPNSNKRKALAPLYEYKNETSAEKRHAMSDAVSSSLGEVPFYNCESAVTQEVSTHVPLTNTGPAEVPLESDATNEIMQVSHRDIPTTSPASVNSAYFNEKKDFSEFSPTLASTRLIGDTPFSSFKKKMTLAATPIAECSSACSESHSEEIDIITQQNNNSDPEVLHIITANVNSMEIKRQTSSAKNDDRTVGISNNSLHHLDNCHEKETSINAENCLDAVKTHTDSCNVVVENKTICSSTTVNYTTVENLIENSLANQSVLHDPTNPFSESTQLRLIDVAALKKKKNYIFSPAQLPFPFYDGCVIITPEHTWIIKQLCGSGSFAHVYLAVSDDAQKDIFALKAQKTQNFWEFHILTSLHERLEKLSDSFTHVQSGLLKLLTFMSCINCSIIQTEYYSKGSLLTIINWHIDRKMKLPYWLTVYYVLEILNIINALHSCEIIHADIKPDNLLIRSIPGPNNFPLKATPSSLVLIDFNRSIDLRLFPDGTTFVTADSVKSELRCPEMRKGQPWTYQIDAFGALNTIHCLMFREYLKIFFEADKWKATHKFPRSYPSVWNELFDQFLNIPSCDAFPCIEDWIKKFETIYQNLDASTKERINMD